MSTICSHTDSITLTELPETVAGCKDCLGIGGKLGTYAYVSVQRVHRMLRQLATSARVEPRRQLAAPDRALR